MLDTYESVYLKNSGLRKETQTAIMNAICLGFADRIDEVIDQEFKLGEIALERGKIGGITFEKKARKDGSRVLK